MRVTTVLGTLKLVDPVKTNDAPLYYDTLADVKYVSEK